MAEVVVDAKAIDALARDIKLAKRALIGNLGERGYQLLRAEVPYETGNLRQGVSPPDVDFENLTATLTVTARSGAAGPREAILIGADGKEKKTVSLRPQAAYNYASVVARGNVEATLRPKTAKAFLIPVTSAPSGESYLIAGGQVYVMRRSRKGQKPNPYDERAAAGLEKDAPGIADAVLKKFI